MASRSPSLPAVRGKLVQLMNVAVAHHQAGRFGEAEIQYQSVLKLDPDNGDVLRLVGGLYVQSGKPDRAVAYLERALLVQPDNAEILNNLGIALRNLGKLDDAIVTFRNALLLDPDYAEALNNLGNTLHLQGRYQDAIPSYEHAIRVKPDYVTAFHNLGNALRGIERTSDALEVFKKALALRTDDPSLYVDMGLAWHRQSDFLEAVTCYQNALRLKPDHFAALSNIGSAMRELSRTAEAAAWYEKALLVRPDSHEVLVNLGATFWDMNQIDRAVACYERALRLKPGYLDALVNLGTAYWGLGKTDLSAARYKEALVIDPRHIDALTNLGALHQDRMELDEATKLYDRALAIKADFPNAQWRKSMILLASGDYIEGWRLYETGLHRRNLRGLGPTRVRPWDGVASLTGKRLLIWGEQGLGDSLQFVRYAQLCKSRGAHVIVLCSNPLLRLFRNSPFIDEATERIGDTEFDYQVSMMSLPHFFGTTLDNVPAAIPYLRVESAVQQRWEQKFLGSKGPKVGLVWAGNAREGMINANMVDRRRSLHLRHLLPLLELKGVRFYNLQMGPSAQHIDELVLRDQVTDYMGEVKDFMDTAALINNLDLVVTVDTSVAHLTGALGKPVWILSRYDACWRWLQNRESSPWYPTARVFGQPAMGDWTSTIQKLTDIFAAEIVGRIDSL